MEDDFSEKGESDKPLLLDSKLSADDALMTEQAQLEAETKRAQEVTSSSQGALRGSGGSSAAVIPLLHLVKQLLRNVSAHTSSLLTEQSLPTTAAPLPEFARSPTEIDLTSDSEDSFLASFAATEEPEARQAEMLPNLNLLLRFQRLLFAQLYPPESRKEGNGDYERDLPGALSLLRKYMQMLSHHVVEVLPQGRYSVASCSQPRGLLWLDLWYET